MIGLVLVSHSRPLAEAAVALATGIVTGAHPDIQIAAGAGDGLGTDAAAISLAVKAADSDDGVLVLVDFGNAVPNSELALAFVDADLADRVLITPAPLVEGLIVAVTAAVAGASLAEAAAQARGALASKQARLDPEGGVDAVVVPPPAPTPSTKKPARLTWRTPIHLEHGLHIRPSAAIITALRELDADVQLGNASTGAGPAPATSLSGLAALEIRQGQILEARISGPDAERARDMLADLAARQFGEATTRPPRSIRLPITPLMAQPAATASGHQIVIGPIHRRTAIPSVDGYHPRSPKTELARFNDAVEEVEDYLDALAIGRPGSSEILQAQSLLVADRELAHGVVGRITEGFSAVDAVVDQLTQLARRLDGLTDPYLRERAQDVRSVRRLLLLSLMRRPLQDDEPAEPCVWLLDELDAATASRLDHRLCLGVITTAGGSRGHGTLTAEARGIPVLAGRLDAGSLPEGTIVAFDPLTRELWIEPDAALVTSLGARTAQRTRTDAIARTRSHDPAYTLDGGHVLVEANVSSLADAQSAALAGADGSGIVRTEILFGARPQAPSVEEQAEVYASIGHTIGGPVTIRTWDAGGDKPLAFLPSEHEANPALGERGIRTMRRVRGLFADQLRAIALAARQTPLRVMFPMVTTPDELRWARGVLDEVLADVGPVDLPVGIMVEVPAAALGASEFAGLVDFVSVGTNDLAQYTLAADRTNAAVAGLLPPDAPSLFTLIGLTRAGLPGIPLAVCGDMAGDPSATARLLALGVTELSVSPPRVPTIKQAVRHVGASL